MEREREKEKKKREFGSCAERQTVTIVKQQL